MVRKIASDTSGLLGEPDADHWQMARRILLNWGLFIFLIALMILFTILEPRFATVTNVQNVLRQAAPLALLACGQSIVLIEGGVDVSVGSIIAFSSVCMVGTVWSLGVIPGRKCVRRHSCDAHYDPWSCALFDWRHPAPREHA